MSDKEQNTREEREPHLKVAPVPRAKPGHRWILGEHRLICGDMRDAAAIDWLLDGGQAAMTFTDPPYNVDYEGGTSKKLKYENDDLTPGAWGEFVEQFCRIIIERTAGAIYICMGSVSLPVVQRVFIESGGHWSSNIIWAKSCST